MKFSYLMFDDEVFRSVLALFTDTFEKVEGKWLPYCQWVVFSLAKYGEGNAFFLIFLRWVDVRKCHSRGSPFSECIIRVFLE